MSPYRVPAWPSTPAPARWTRVFVPAVLGGAFVAAGATTAWLQAREARRNEAIWSALAALQASEGENARRISELQGSRFERPTDDDRAEIFRTLSEEKRGYEPRGGRAVYRHTRDLPRCVCAAGDPLCSEIPGQTCAP